MRANTRTIDLLSNLTLGTALTLVAACHGGGGGGDGDATQGSGSTGGESGTSFGETEMGDDG
ncbi:MAG TPA: hypothetical protein PKW35_06620, partial [Nannocystaceae bacterium]|nr:hypothetical protein [Nannocystaceae bacterium]